MPLETLDLPTDWRSAMKKLLGAYPLNYQKALIVSPMREVEAMSKSKCRTRETRTTACTRGGMSPARTLWRGFVSAPSISKSYPAIGAAPAAFPEFFCGSA